MITEEIKIPTDGRPLEAFVKYRGPKPEKAFLILPGQGYTINHFVLDFLWRMAAENGYYAIKAEYRGFTYRHFNEPYNHEQAAVDARYVLDYLANQGYMPEQITACGKSLGSIALGSVVVIDHVSFDKVILLTPVLYVDKAAGIFPHWAEFSKSTKNLCLVFGSVDDYCDLETAMDNFPKAVIKCYEGADHGLHIEGDYSSTIQIQREIIELVRKFIS